MPVVLQVLRLWVVDIQVASLVVLLLMPVVRALRAMLRFTLSLVLMMLKVLLVVLVWVRVWAVSGLCSRVGSLCSRVRARWAVALAGHVGGVGRW